MRKIVFLLLSASLVFVACNSESTANKAEVSKEGEAAEASSMASTYTINAEKSTLHWEGYKPAGSHHGTLKLKEGSISMKDGQIEAGKFVIDMTSINCEDLEGEDKASLEAHLKGTGDEGKEDFFNVTSYPTATFELTNIKPIDDSMANVMVSGNLSLLDSTKQISFKANVESMEDMVKISSPTFSIDRTNWGIGFMSKSIFDNLKDNFINDKFDLSLDLVANKKMGTDHVEDHDHHEHDHSH